MHSQSSHILSSFKNFLIRPPRTKTTSERRPPFSLGAACSAVSALTLHIKKNRLFTYTLQVTHSIGCWLLALGLVSTPLVGVDGGWRDMT